MKDVCFLQKQENVLYCTFKNGQIFLGFIFNIQFCIMHLFSKWPQFYSILLSEKEQVFVSICCKRATPPSNPILPHAPFWFSDTKHGLEICNRYDLLSQPLNREWGFLLTWWLLKVAMNLSRGFQFLRTKSYATRPLLLLSEHMVFEFAERAWEFCRAIKSCWWPEPLPSTAFAVSIRNRHGGQPALPAKRSTSFSSNQFLVPSSHLSLFKS